MARLVGFMASSAHPNAVLNFLADFFPDLYLPSDHAEEPVVKHIHAVEDGETEVGFFHAPLHRSAHALFSVIPEVEFSALESRCVIEKRSDRFGGRIRFEFGRVSAGARLTIDLKPWQRSCLRVC